MTGHCSLRTRGGLESSFRVSYRTDTSAPTSATSIHTLQLSLPAVVAVCGTCTSVLSRRVVGCDAASSPRLALCTSFRPRFGRRDQAPKQLVRLGANHRQKHGSFLFPVGDSVSRQEVSEAFCVLRPFLAAFLEFAHMTKRASVITGLDYWTGLLDWTTGL